MAQPILTANQIRAWDQFTIDKEPINSVDLMERAACSFFSALKNHEFYSESVEFLVFCGNGNNGGDGLAIARLLRLEGCSVTVYIINVSAKTSPDFSINLAKLKQFEDVALNFIEDEKDFPTVLSSYIIPNYALGIFSGYSKG